MYLEVRVALKGFPVLLVIAIGVAHRMGVLALDHWPSFLRLVGPCLDLQVACNAAD